jgi:hypothetical protein
MRRAKTKTFLLIVVAIAATAVVTTSHAGKRGKWDVVSSGGSNRPGGEIGHVRTPDGVLHVLWVRRTGGNSYDLLHSQISSVGAVRAPTPVVTGWAGLGGVSLVAPGGGVLYAWFPGIRTTAPDEPYFGLNFASWSTVTWSLAGSGSSFRDQFAHGRTPGASVVQRTGVVTSAIAWDGRDGVGVLGAGPSFKLGYGPNGSTATCCNHGVNIATHAASGRTFLAWCTMNEGVNGIWAQEVDTSGRSRFGSPLGAALRMPGSTNAQGRRICDAGQRVPLVVRPDGTFWIAAKDGADRSVLVWRIGASRVTRVASGRGTFRRVGLAAAPDGRLWVGWGRFQNAARLQFRRSNARATLFGAVVNVPGPRRTVEVQVIDASAQQGRLDVLATYSAISGSDLWHSQALPGLTLTATGGRVVRFRVTDAGEPVARATIAVAGRRLRTNSAGRASVDLRPGRHSAMASKRGYVGARARVRSR